MGVIETHAHIYAKEFDTDRDLVIDTARDQGVEKILMPNINSNSIDFMMEAESKYGGYCHSMMGLHPCYVKSDFEKELYIVEDWLSKRDFVAVGEIGMDLHWDNTFKEQQEEAFKVQVQWAKDYKIPIAIHARKANQELLQILEQVGTDDLTGVFHCFSGSVEEGMRAKELGFHLGMGGVITFKNAGMDQVVKELGFEKLVLETDCPYLAPVPHRGKRNEVSYVNLVAEKLAHIFEMSLDEVNDQTTKNATVLFGLEKA